MKYFPVIALAGLCLLGACSSETVEPEIRIPPRIAAQLTPGVLDSIVLGDSTQPVVSGSWQRFTPETTWTWQLQGNINTSYDVDVYVLDLFQMAEGNVIDTLHAQNKSVICYFSAGTYESWRPDARFFDDVPLGNAHADFTDERWLDTTSVQARKIMVNRMDMALAAGCDGVELDNVDGFSSDTGLGVSFEQEKEYQRLLANEAHKRNLTVVLKNSIEAVPEMVDFFDMAISESCFIYDECGVFSAMIAAGKPVFHAEYDVKFVNNPEELAAMCARSAALNLRTLVMPRELDDAFRISCD